MLKQWLREPLLHFLLIGALLFVFYGIQNDGVSDRSKRIVFTSDDINRLITLWEKQRQRPPTQAELEGFIEQKIREQVFYREALVMGLDKNDSIVRRRLAQKVEFISADLAALVEPTDAELNKYLTTHADKFKQPWRLDFKQIYFNADKRNSTAQADAVQALSKIKSNNANIDIHTFGDSFMMGQEFSNLAEFEVERLFGKDFSTEVSSLPVNKWQGPIYSSYGYHLVFISKRIEAQLPLLKNVRAKVRTEWMNQQRLIVDKAFYEGLRQQYDIVIEDARLKSLSASAK